MGRPHDRLRPGGRLIVLSPAHNHLYSDFDKVIGHFRRYSRASLQAAVPQAMIAEKLIYLDSVGMAATLANYFVLGQSMPTEMQILIWDRLMVPVSRLLDPLTFGAFGKSVLGVWKKPS